MRVRATHQFNREAHERSVALGHGVAAVLVRVRVRVRVRAVS